MRSKVIYLIAIGFAATLAISAIITVSVIYSKPSNSSENSQSTTTDSTTAQSSTTDEFTTEEGSGSGNYRETSFDHNILNLETFTDSEERNPDVDLIYEGFMRIKTEKLP